MRYFLVVSFYVEDFLVLIFTVCLFTFLGLRVFINVPISKPVFEKF